MESIEALMRYPTRREDWVATLVIGAALTAFGFLVIPAIVVTGYVIAVIRGRLTGATAPPGFEHWRELFVDGLKAWVVAFVYGIVPVVLGGLVFGGSIAALASGSEIGTAVGLLGLGLGSLVWLLVALAFFYPLPASLANLALTGRLGAAFDVDTIRRVVSTRSYAVPWLWGLAVLVVGGAIGGAVNGIPILGWILGAFVLFYVDVVLGAIWAAGFADALEGSGTVARVVETEPASG